MKEKQKQKEKVDGDVRILIVDALVAMWRLPEEIMPTKPNKVVHASAIREALSIFSCFLLALAQRPEGPRATG